MATFDTNTYLNNKLAQLNRDQEGGHSWTMADLNKALTDANLTPEQHYAQYGRSEGVIPYADSLTFDTNAYLTNKTAQLNRDQEQGKSDWNNASTLQAITDAGMNPAEHYAQYGRSEGITPYADYAGFDTNAYLTNKTSQLNRDQERGKSDWNNASTLQAITAEGMTPLEHYLQFGIKEGVNPTTVMSGIGTTGTDPNELVGKGNAVTGGKTYDSINVSNLKELGVGVGEQVRIGDYVYTIHADGSLGVANSNYVSQGGTYDKDLSSAFGLSGNASSGGTGGTSASTNNSGTGNGPSSGTTDAETLLAQIASMLGQSTNTGKNESATSGLSTTDSTNWITGDGQKSADAPAYQSGYATFSAPQAKDWISLFNGQGFGTFSSPKADAQLNNLLSFGNLYNYANNVTTQQIDPGNKLASIQQAINEQVSNGSISSGKAQEILAALEGNNDKLNAVYDEIQNSNASGSSIHNSVYDGQEYQS